MQRGARRRPDLAGSAIARRRRRARRPRNKDKNDGFSVKASGAARTGAWAAAKGTMRKTLAEERQQRGPQTMGGCWPSWHRPQMFLARTGRPKIKRRRRAAAQAGDVSAGPPPLMRRAGWQPGSCVAATPPQSKARPAARAQGTKAARPGRHAEAAEDSQTSQDSNPRGAPGNDRRSHRETCHAMPTQPGSPRGLAAARHGRDGLENRRVVPPPAIGLGAAASLKGRAQQYRTRERAPPGLSGTVPTGGVFPGSGELSMGTS